MRLGSACCIEFFFKLSFSFYFTAHFNAQIYLIHFLPNLYLPLSLSQFILLAFISHSLSFFLSFFLPFFSLSICVSISSSPSLPPYYAPFSLSLFFKHESIFLCIPFCTVFYLCTALVFLNTESPFCPSLCYSFSFTLSYFFFLYVFPLSSCSLPILPHSISVSLSVFFFLSSFVTLMLFISICLLMSIYLNAEKSYLYTELPFLCFLA